MASISVEDFLKNVYVLKSFGYRASSSALAKRLMVSNAAVTDMSKKLSKQNLIVYQKYRDIQLTHDGEVVALGVIRRHRLWELFLNKILNIPWERVHDEAEKLEHQTSEYLIDEIDRYLGYPGVDPHGDPIPDRFGNIIQNNYVKLSELESRANLLVRRIKEHYGETMTYLNQIELKLDHEISYIDAIPNKDALLILIDGNEVEMPVSIAENIFVEII